MSFSAQYVIGNQSRVVMRGTAPVKAKTWRVTLWLTNPEGVKATHSATVQRETFQGIVPVVMAMLDNLIEQEGDIAKSAGWQVCVH